MDTYERVVDGLGRGELAVVADGDYAGVVAAFQEVEQHDTHFAGALYVLETPAGLAVAEQDPTSKRGVFRAFASLEAARAFVEQRLATYDRMWDGCGCKVDYFGP